MKKKITIKPVAPKKREEWEELVGLLLNSNHTVSYYNKDGLLLLNY